MTQIVKISPDRLYHEPDEVEITSSGINWSIYQGSPLSTDGDSLPTILYGNREIGSLAYPDNWISFDTSELVLPGYLVDKVLDADDPPDNQDIPIPEDPDSYFDGFTDNLSFNTPSVQDKPNKMTIYGATPSRGGELFCISYSLDGSERCIDPGLHSFVSVTYNGHKYVPSRVVDTNKYNDEEYPSPWLWYDTSDNHTGSTTYYTTEESAIQAIDSVELVLGESRTGSGKDGFTIYNVSNSDLINYLDSDTGRGYTEFPTIQDSEGRTLFLSSSYQIVNSYTTYTTIT